MEKRNVSQANGFANESSCGGDRRPLRTYKRRKCGGGGVTALQNSSEAPAEDRSSEKIVKGVVELGLQKKSCEQVCDPMVNCRSILNCPDDCSDQQWRGVLDSICRSLKPTEGGSGHIQNIVTDMLNCVQSSNAKITKDDNDHSSSQFDVHGTILNGCSTVAEGVSVVTSNGSSNESVDPTMSRLCEHAFYKLLVSGKFVSLCKLLSENFHGLNIDKLMDFSIIISRMKEGLYESNPTLFSSDIQQIWRRLISIGSEMVSLSNDLLELSRAFCREMGGSTYMDTSGDRKHEVPSRVCNLQIKQEDLDLSVFCACRQCGERSDGRDCLVCDSCEAMFHVSCIEPRVKEIPDKSWYCASCTHVGLGTSHSGCVVCERLGANSSIHGVDSVCSYEEIFYEFE